MDGSTLRTGLDGIQQQVEERLTKLLPIRAHRRHQNGSTRRDRHLVLLSIASNCSRDLPGQFCRIATAELGHARMSIRQEFSDQALNTVGFAAQYIGIALKTKLGRYLRGQHLRCCPDDRKWVTHLVRQPSSQLPERGKALRLTHLLLKPPLLG